MRTLAARGIGSTDNSTSKLPSAKLQRGGAVLVTGLLLIFGVNVQVIPPPPPVAELVQRAAEDDDDEPDVV